MNSSSTDLLATAQCLQQQDLAYALVTVVRAQAPASARPGDKALVTAEGIVQGWIGGGCAQPAVLRTVRQALHDGRARMIRIAPAAEGEQRDASQVLDDVLEFGMTCHSGGTLELFIDPMLPPARLTVIGDSPVAVALVGLAPRVGLQVTAVAQGADPLRFADAAQVVAGDDAAAVAAQVAPGGFVVVATQGRRDVQGLRAALALQARQIWFVASARKAQVLRASLIEAGQDADAVRAIIAPAGQLIGAQTPEEIALSVLAAVVAMRRSGQRAPVAAKPVVLPLPDLAPIAGSCCGGGEAPTSAATAATAASAAVQPVAAAAPTAASATIGGGSCCGG
jgi:xanthine dehydrogenase accessory factor